MLATDHGRAAYSSISTDYPKEWSDVRPGMTSEEARKILGNPWADGRGLKTVDRWRIKEAGVELHLDLGFDTQNEPNSIVSRVSRWKYFMAYESERSDESLTN